MSRTLSTCATLPVSGSYIVLPFPDIARPVPGGWTVEVSLRKTSPADGDAYIMVNQGGRVIATKKVTPTTSFANYSLTLSEEDLELVTTGLCHVSSPQVIIYGTVVVDCCPGVEIPQVLQLSITNDMSCECCPTTAALTYDADVDGWVNGSVSVGTCGTTLGVKVYCDHMTGNWKMDLSGCNTQTGVSLAVTSCDPFHGTSNYAGAMGVCCDHPEPVNVHWAVTA